jgi:hypothetical protein
VRLWSRGTFSRSAVHEIWSRPLGRRVGVAAPDLRWLSPSGELGLGTRGTVRLHRLRDGETLEFLLTGRQATTTVFVSAGGQFVGDESAFDLVRFARGRSLREAEPLTGNDLASQYHHPDLLTEFLGGTSRVR